MIRSFPSDYKPSDEEVAALRAANLAAVETEAAARARLEAERGGAAPPPAPMNEEAADEEDGDG